MSAFSKAIIYAVATFAVLTFAHIRFGTVVACAPATKQIAIQPALSQYASDRGDYMPVPYIIDDAPQIPLHSAIAVDSTSSSAAKPQIFLGDYANAIFQWLAPVLVPIFAGFLLDLLIKVRTWLGQTTTDAQRDKLQDIAVNAVNLALHEGGHALVGRLPVQTNNLVMARAIDYVQAHGTDTIKALGLDPTDQKAVEAIKGHIATILAQKQAYPSSIIMPSNGTSPATRS